MTKLFSREWRNSSRYPLTITTLCLAILLAGPITVAYLVQAFQIEAFAQQEKTSKEAVITAESVRPHIEFLADDRFEGRGGGYRGEEKAAEYIARQFRKIGLTPAANMNGKPRSYFQGFRFHPRHPVVPWEMLRSRNVLGMIEGDDPNLKNEVVVIGAHYDGQGRTGQADPLRLPASDPNLARDEIWNSANDNAVSVASIIEIARAIKKGNTRTKRTLLFVAFGAEEHGMAVQCIMCVILSFLCAAMWR